MVGNVTFLFLQFLICYLQRVAVKIMYKLQFYLRSPYMRTLVKSPMVDEERMTSGHWLVSVLLVSFGV